MPSFTSLLAAPASKVDSDTEDSSNKKKGRKFLSSRTINLDAISNNIYGITVIRVGRYKIDRGMRQFWETLCRSWLESIHGWSSHREALSTVKEGYCLHTCVGAVTLMIPPSTSCLEVITASHLRRKILWQLTWWMEFTVITVAKAPAQ